MPKVHKSKVIIDAIQQTEGHNPPDPLLLTLPAPLIDSVI